MGSSKEEKKKGEKLGGKMWLSIGQGQLSSCLVL